MPKFVGRMARLLLKSHLLTIFLVLFVLGYWVGTRLRPDPLAEPYGELFDHLGVTSYRETPSESSGHFVVELSAGGRVFRRFDIDSRRFETPIRGREYRYSINGTRYLPLEVRGHVDRGFWLELPGAYAGAFRPDQLAELYRSTMGYVRPVSIASEVLGTLSGYSVGFRSATWGSSFANPSVQKRLLASPNFGRVLAHEAWRRVLLEPVLMDDENDAARFAAVRGMQRIYTNFFRLALNDSDGFIPREVARLDSLGFVNESHAMQAFADAARRAATDSCDLSSADFIAIEEWASLLDQRGHWAVAAMPPAGEPRMRYLGMLAWYGLAPASADERRLWVGPRVLVREGELAGFIADDIPLTRAGCPESWSRWLRADHGVLESNAWTAEWSGAREFAPLIQYGRSFASSWHSKP
jgi:hypothetical protein